jgi:uncharacterized protein (DUF302 family)
MGWQAGVGPAGARPTSGVVHKRSPLSVAETVDRLATAIRAAGAKLFFVVVGNPAGGTPAMVASPLAALDLPLKVLVWRDDDGTVWMSYLDAAWLAARHGLATELAAPLSAIDGLTAQVAAR